MSDISRNAIRYTNSNTKRSDHPNPHNGEIIDKQKNGSPVIGFDCSGFVCHVLIESGYRVDYEGTSGIRVSSAYVDIANFDDVKPGDLILFEGHVGIVIQYHVSASIGKFIHMKGSNNQGKLTTSGFVTNENKYKQHLDEIPVNQRPQYFYYGKIQKIIAFKRVKNERYSHLLDLHYKEADLGPTSRPLGTNLYYRFVRQTRALKGKGTKSLPREKKIKKNLPIIKKLYLLDRMWGWQRRNTDFTKGIPYIRLSK
jgi:hypothetical protein